MSQKQPKLKVIIHIFVLSCGPRSGWHGVLSRDMGCRHWQTVKWLGTDIWIHLCSFWGNFGFHYKWTNAVFKGFSRQCKWCEIPAQCYKSRRLSKESFKKIWWPCPENSKIDPKTANIEGYNTRFRIFSGPELGMPRDASEGPERLLKRSHVAWSKYVDAFMFISRQF